MFKQTKGHVQTDVLKPGDVLEGWHWGWRSQKMATKSVETRRNICQIA